MNGKPLLTLLIAGLFLQSAGAAELAPVDEAVRNPALFTFRAQFQAALARRDAGTVLAAIDPNIKAGFGGEDGIENFKKQWEFPGAESRLWGELGMALALGGSFFDENTFIFPYVHSRWPDAIDAFQYTAVVGSEVRVRAKPSPEAPVLANLSFEIVRLGEPGAQEGWTAVKLQDGRQGYVSSRYLRSSVGYRGYFTNKNGSWRLSLFVAGD